MKSRMRMIDLIAICNQPLWEKRRRRRRATWTAAGTMTTKSWTPSGERDPEMRSRRNQSNHVRDVLPTVWLIISMGQSNTGIPG